MSVGNILTLASGKMGLNQNDPNQRAVMLRFLNEGANELYMQCDLVGSLIEQVFKVNGDQTIALPSEVGYIRGIREYSSFIPWSISQMRPRYNQSNWNDFWRNFRLQGKRALEKTVTNQSLVTVTVPEIESTPISVSVTGPTPVATSITETLVMSALSKTTENSFLDITAFTKSKITMYDVTLTDIDNITLAIIPNNALASAYQVVDVSTCPWLNNSGNALDHYLEVLYKKALPILSADGDEFPAPGYDYVLANKMLQVWAQEQGNVQESLAYDQLTTRSIARINEEQNRATEDCLPLVEHPHDCLNPRIRPRRPGRYGGYSTTTRYGSM